MPQLRCDLGEVPEVLVESRSGIKLEELARQGAANSTCELQATSYKLQVTS